MEPKEILEHHRSEPFRPFRIHLCDGATYEITRRELMMVARTRLIVGLDPDQDGLPRQSLYVSPDDVTRIEHLDSEADGKRTPRRTGKRTKKRARQLKTA